jgi:TIR domain
MTRVFVNYRSSDEPYGAILIDRMLVDRFGPEHVFRDTRTMLVGTHYPDLLWRAVRECQVLVAVIGPRWLERDSRGRRRIDEPDDYVRLEIAHVLRRGITVVPLLLDDTPAPRTADLPPDIAGLAQRQYRTVRRRSAEHDIDRILTEIESWVPRKAPWTNDRYRRAISVFPADISPPLGPSIFRHNSGPPSLGGLAMPEMGS